MNKSIDTSTEKNNAKMINDSTLNGTDSIQKSNNLHHNRLVRLFFMFCGCVVFIIGLVGVVVPLLPTTPFIILAAAFWAKGSERFHTWIISHKVFGKMILDWQEKRAIPKYAKYLAWSMMTLSCVMVFYRLPTDMHWLGWVCVVSSLSVSIWMARLPNA